MHDLFAQVIFYVFATLAVIAAVMVVTQSNPVRSVLMLVLTFFAMAVLWLLASAEFLALILVLVYVGAVMTLFLFVVMMLNIDTASKHSHFVRYLPFGLILVALLIGLLLIALPDQAFKSSVEQLMVVTNNQMNQLSTTTRTLSNTESIGMVLYTDYVFAFELAAVLLLVAIISAITLAHRTVTRSKRQNIVTQIMTTKEERLSIISMKSEKN